MIGFFDRVEVLLNRPSHELLVAIEELSTGGGFDDLLLLYLSCHGVVDHQRGGSLYFAASNTRSSRLASASVPARYVNEQFSHATARSRVLSLDCCFSGQFAEGFGSKSDVDPLRDVAGGGYVVITASDSVGVAYEESPGSAIRFHRVLGMACVRATPTVTPTGSSPRMTCSTTQCHGYVPGTRRPRNTSPPELTARSSWHGQRGSTGLTDPTLPPGHLGTGQLPSPTSPPGFMP